MSDNKCVICSKDVRPRLHSVFCAFCNSWQHTTCHTGKNATVSEILLSFAFTRDEFQMSRDFLAWVFRGVIMELARVFCEAWRTNMSSCKESMIASVEKFNNGCEEDYFLLLLQKHSTIVCASLISFCVLYY